MVVSTSTQSIRPKVYTYGYSPEEVPSLDDLSHIANTRSVSGAVYKDGHRSAANITQGSNIILIDCDEQGQAEEVEAKLRHYDYVKVPSASNREHPYKWHFFVPTQEPLSIYPAAFRYQVEQFFAQVGITDAMIDTTGSYDAARQFAPASIGMSQEEADELSEVHYADLQAPVIEAPKEFCSPAAKSTYLEVGGVPTDILPLGSVWYQGKALPYPEVIKAVNGALTGGDTLVSGFGCPNNNPNHSGDNRTGYGFGFIDTTTGDCVIKCTGNACKDKPYFTVPIVADDIAVTEIIECDSPVGQEVYRQAMEIRWNSFGQVKPDGMDYNWRQFASAMNNVIACNTDGANNPTAYVLSMPTGSSKTQGCIVYLAELAKADTKVKGMMVVRLNSDAKQVATQINEIGGNAVDFNSTSDISIEDAASFSTVIVSHEFFMRNGHKGNQKWNTLAEDRKLFIVDEALHNVEASRLDSFDIQRMMMVSKALKNQAMTSLLELYHDFITTDLPSSDETGFIMLQDISRTKEYSEAVYESVFGNNTIFELEMFSKDNVIAENVETVDSFISTLGNMDNSNGFVCRALRIHQSSFEWRYKSEVVYLAEKLRTVLTSGAFASKRGNSITGVKELIPNGISFAVLDATAPVNTIYQLQRTHRQDIVMVQTKQVRTYKGFDIKIANTVTGAGSLNREMIHTMLDDINQQLTADNKLFIVTHRSLEAEVLLWQSNTEVEATIALDHFGNITGKNDWKDFDCVAVIGLPHKPNELIQSLNIIKTTEELAYSGDGKKNFTSIEVSDLASDLVQAMARIRVRNVVGTGGECLPSRAWITVSKLSKYNGAIRHSLAKQFPDATLSDWELPTEIATKIEFAFSYEPTVNYLQARLKKMGDELDIYTPRDELNINRESYRRMMASDAFLEALKKMGVTIELRKGKDKRGRTKKLPASFFVSTCDTYSQFD